MSILGWIDFETDKGRFNGTAHAYREQEPTGLPNN